MGPLRHSAAGLAALAGAPLLAGALLVRPSWRVGISERLGAVERGSRGGVWVHGASVGEALAALRLIRRLREGGRDVFATATTADGREVLRRSLRAEASALAPLDHPWCVARALSRIRPELLVLVETELWPCLIAGAQRAGVKVAVASGRLSDRSFPRYRRVRGLIARTLSRLDAVGARSELDAERFVSLGLPRARVFVTGDLKLEPSARHATLAPDLRRVLGRAPLFVAGSTHAGEDSAALQALERCEREGLQLSLVLAPRHLERVAALERRVRATGRPVRRRSALGDAPLQTGEVLLLDSFGELAAVYRLARICFVGGTLARVGGHNLLEPLFAGSPVVFGPHCQNVRAAAEIAAQSGAGLCIEDAEGLADAVARALRDPAAQRERVARAQGALREHRGAAQRTFEMVEALLGAHAHEQGDGGAPSRPGDSDGRRAGAPGRA